MSKMIYRLLLWVLVTMIPTGCCSVSAMSQYRGKGFLLYAHASRNRTAAVMNQAQTFLHCASSYLGLGVPEEPHAWIYLHRWRWDLWRHLGEVCPQWRWRRAACCEYTGNYVIATYGMRSEAALLRDLRHELTHYLIASNFSDIPPWIDEGLAELMETGSCPLNRAHDDAERVHDILNGASVEDLRNLLSVPSGGKLNNRQYRLAWAWSHVLLTRLPGGKEKLLEYLKQTHSAMDQEKLFASVWGASLEEIATLLKGTPDN